MKKIVVLGAGGFAKEVIAWIKGSEQYVVDFAVVDQTISEKTCAGIPVKNFDDIDELYYFVLAVSDPQLKRKFVKKALEKNWKPCNYIDHRAVVSPDVKLGKGVFIAPLVSIGADANVGDYVIVNVRCGFGHNVVIGSYSTLLGSNTINGGVQIGEDVVLGAASVIYPNVKIGSKAVVGIGSVVLRNIQENTTVFGIPAKKIAST